MSANVPDRVVVDDGMQPRELPVSEFLALPLTERVRYLLADRVRFFVGQRSVPTSAALQSLMNIARPPREKP